MAGADIVIDEEEQIDKALAEQFDLQQSQWEYI